MYLEDDIVAVSGAGGLIYAKNKNRGGRSSAKGRDFEVVYGAYKIALEAATALKSEENGLEISFHDQVLCFVDDFIVSKPNGRRLSQLKSGAAAWSSGPHHLEEDFRLQMKLDSSCGVVAEYELVVGDEETCNRLAESRPDDLSAVSVATFPGELTDRSLIAKLSDLGEALTELSPRDEERVVKEQVWRMLLGTWQASRGEQTLADVINAAAHGPGAIVAPLHPPYTLSEAAKKVLDNVDGVRFNIRKSFLAYEALDGRVRGVAEYHCYSPQFEAFVENLIAVQPTDFLSFWEVLKAHI